MRRALGHLLRLVALPPLLLKVRANLAHGSHALAQTRVRAKLRGQAQLLLACLPSLADSCCEGCNLCPRVVSHGARASGYLLQCAQKGQHVLRVLVASDDAQALQRASGRLCQQRQQTCGHASLLEQSREKPRRAGVLLQLQGAASGLGPRA